jgi:hypothetical protein
MVSVAEFESASYNVKKERYVETHFLTALQLKNDALLMIIGLRNGGEMTEKW